MLLLSYALRNIIRNPLLSASSILVITLIGFFLNILVLLIHTTDQTVADINNRLSLKINLSPGIERSHIGIDAIFARIAQISPSIEARYTSATQALDILRSRDPNLVKIVENASENPLPNSISFFRIPLEKYDALDRLLREYSDILDFSAPDTVKGTGYASQKEKIVDLIRILDFTRSGIVSIVLLFLLTVAIILYNVIGNFVFFHIDEIMITDLVGGDAKYISGPFMFQGGIFGALGGGIAYILFLSMISYSSLVSTIFDTSTFVQILEGFFSDHMTTLIILVIGITLIGMISGAIASIRYARLIRQKS